MEERERKTLVWKKEGEDCIEEGGRDCIEEENRIKVCRKEGDNNVERDIEKGEVSGMFALKNVLKQTKVTLRGFG
jgi:hypothetical protein